MDWKQVIERNREALAVVVAGLVALLGQRDTLPRHLLRSIHRILRPAESALRRLIVIVAAVIARTASPLRGVSRRFAEGEVAVPVAQRKASERRDAATQRGPGRLTNCSGPSRGRLGTERPLPDFSIFTRRDRQPAFRLIDPRKRFAESARRIGPQLGIPRISVPGFMEPIPVKPTGNDDANAAAILRRIESLNSALKTLPRQARRLNRLMARRAKAKPGPGRVGPIRPGYPPGYRKRSTEPVDDTLRDCHFLALESGFKPP